jgi:2,3-bisphosphoglycerate-dependent phosphoglycerate mutase
MQLYIIRHAQSDNNELYHRTGATLGRHSDPPLTAIGHEQARLLAQFLAGYEAGELGYNAHLHNRNGFQLTHLYTSLMTRAIETATYMVEEIDISLYGWPEIHERGGLYTEDEAGQVTGKPGLNRPELHGAYPHLILPASVGESGWWSRSRESIEESIDRARLVWERLVERHDDEDRVALVTHGGFFQSLLSIAITEGELVQKVGKTGIGFGISNASISRIDLDDSGIVIRYLNRVDFLPGRLITG